MEYRTACENFPGIGCARKNAAGKTTVEYHGVADRESNTPVTGDTVFPACSISKFITAICVMKLHEQGAIRSIKRRRYRNCKILDGETNLTVDVNSSDHQNCWSLDLSSSSSCRLSMLSRFILWQAFSIE